MRARERLQILYVLCSCHSNLNRMLSSVYSIPYMFCAAGYTCACTCTCVCVWSHVYVKLLSTVLCVGLGVEQSSAYTVDGTVKTNQSTDS